MHLEEVELKRGETVYQIAGPIEHVYFPTSALISTFVDTATGASAEVSLVGKDGALGVTSLLTGARVPFRATVDTGGLAHRIRSDVLRDELFGCASLRQALMRHLTARVTQIAGTALCNVRHSVQQRLCRALLMRLDHLENHELFFTQECMAQVLSVHRPAVSEAAASLRRAGVIDYRRGKVVVRDRQLLLDSACECYATIKQQIQRLTEP